MKEEAYLVTGATGTIGTQVVHALLRLGKRVRILTRNATEHSKNIEVFEGDLNKPHTLKEALVGITGIHLISFGDENYNPLSSGKQIIEMVENAGVKRVTVLWNGEGNESSIEQEVKKSNLEWTILQPQEYMANALGWAESIKESSEVKEPFGDRPTAVVNETDIGEVVCKILTTGGHSKQIYTLTGPDTLTPKKQVQEIAVALNKEVKFIELDEHQTKKRWKDWGLPKETMEYLYEWYGNTPSVGYTVTNTVEQILGTPPRTFKEWTIENLHHFHTK
ncbi:NmrA family NAD(P)-binding protein [Belliella marina]|uniref:NmrA family NAD(P)-binding protein n=1 Tax=Belliella marina TaxID=1644146 RepID=A0ABW4VTP0_9BACT